MEKENLTESVVNNMCFKDPAKKLTFELMRSIKKNKTDLRHIETSEELQYYLQNQWIEDVLCIVNVGEGQWLAHSPIVIRLEYHDLYIKRKQNGILELFIGVVDTEKSHFLNWSEKLNLHEKGTQLFIWYTYTPLSCMRGSFIRRIQTQRVGIDHVVDRCVLVSNEGIKLRIDADNISYKRLE